MSDLDRFLAAKPPAVPAASALRAALVLSLTHCSTVIRSTRGRRLVGLVGRGVYNPQIEMWRSETILRAAAAEKILNVCDIEGRRC